MAHAEAVGPPFRNSDELVSTQVNEVAESVDRAPELFSLSLDLFSLAGRDGFFRRLSPAFARAFGYTESELLGRRFISFVHSDDRALTRDELEKLFQGQPALGFENRFQAKDGQYRWLAWTAISTPEGLAHPKDS